MSKSKYIGKIFGGWKVEALENVNRAHKRFYLTKEIINRGTGEILILTISVRDNQLTKLSRGIKTIEELIANKTYQVAKNLNVFQNSIYSRIKGAKIHI